MTKVAEKKTLFPRFRRFFSSEDRYRSALKVTSNRLLGYTASTRTGRLNSPVTADQLKLTPANRDLQLRITLARQ
jgi:hypothetical protein